ncbi:hypothetical protein ARMGADRAFT_531743 [Armillaria gallica]|uniref:Uncharacterized protein n=1 Tax=Armillaria gallica TaxID=47427 RepID=A0A2H3CU29_ARMGA|nr:hypothetical protein ARMGADRAFT_531743 [Armillaria gallica]
MLQVMPRILKHIIIDFFCCPPYVLLINRYRSSRIASFIGSIGRPDFLHSLMEIYGASCTRTLVWVSMNVISNTTFNDICPYRFIARSQGTSLFGDPYTLSRTGPMKRNSAINLLNCLLHDDTNDTDGFISVLLVDLISLSNRRPAAINN